MPDLKLTLACGNYDRTQALRDGRVKPEGIDLTYIPQGPGELFWRLLEFGEFDISEMSFSNYLTERGGGNPRFIAIPVFLSRRFNHSCIFINKKSGITKPEDLKGKKVGLPEYNLTATVWVRGFLEHDYRVAPSDIEWYTSDVSEFGLPRKTEINPPPNVHIRQVPEGRALNDMLASGELDAYITPSPPPCYLQKHPDVDMLFPNYQQIEMDYYKRTRIFPIRHTVIIKRDLCEAHPWVAYSMFKAFSEAKKMGQASYSASGGLACMIPWVSAHYQSVVSLMGEDFFPYGIEANRIPIEAFTQYSSEQGLSRRRLEIDELFAPNTLKQFMP